MWCKLAHLGTVSAQSPTPSTDDMSSPTNPPAHAQRDRQNPFTPRVLHGEVAKAILGSVGAKVDTNYTGSANGDMDSASEPDFFSLQDDYISL